MPHLGQSMINFGHDPRRNTPAAGPDRPPPPDRTTLLRRTDSPPPLDLLKFLALSTTTPYNSDPTKNWPKSVKLWPKQVVAKTNRGGAGNAVSLVRSWPKWVAPHRHATKEGMKEEGTADGATPAIWPLRESAPPMGNNVTSQWCLSTLETASSVLEPAWLCVLNISGLRTLHAHPPPKMRIALRKPSAPKLSKMPGLLLWATCPTRASNVPIKPRRELIKFVKNFFSSKSNRSSGTNSVFLGSRNVFSVRSMSRATSTPSNAWRPLENSPNPMLQTSLAEINTSQRPSENSSKRLLNLVLEMLPPLSSKTSFVTTWMPLRQFETRREEIGNSLHPLLSRMRCPSLFAVILSRLDSRSTNGEQTGVLPLLGLRQIGGNKTSAKSKIDSEKKFKTMYA